MILQPYPCSRAILWTHPTPSLADMTAYTMTPNITTKVANMKTEQMMAIVVALVSLTRKLATHNAMIMSIITNASM